MKLLEFRLTGLAGAEGNVMQDLYNFNDEPVKLNSVKVIHPKVAPKSTYKDRNAVDERVTDKKFTKEAWDNFISFINEHKEIK